MSPEAPQENPGFTSKYIETPEEPALDEATKERIRQDYEKLLAARGETSAAFTESEIESPERTLEVTRNIDARTNTVIGVSRDTIPTREMTKDEQREQDLERIAEHHEGGFEEAFNNPKDLVERMFKLKHFTEAEVKDRTALNFVKSRRESLLIKRGLMKAKSRHNPLLGPQ
ncbi:MAG: hypothetical protein KBD16_00035 [Candidatus Pacebacteria bacterium]|nr:hypothetical protein [Candidatus Paceibacterota bacterium]